MPEIPPHDPRYRRDLSDGLVARWSAPVDLPGIQELYRYVFRESPEAPLNTYAAEWAADFADGRHPLGGPGDFALVEETHRGAIVAALIVMRQPFEYAGVRLAVGRPEFVASHPDYRNRGLVRAIFDMFHARSAARGDDLQAITGIEYYYRQFGYEYALDLASGYVVPFSAIPPLKEGECEVYALRDATSDDMPLLLRLYARDRARVPISTPIDEPYWHWMLDGQRDAAGKGWRPQIVSDTDGTPAGYVLMRRLRAGAYLDVSAIGFEAGVPPAAALPAVLRALRDRAPSLPGWTSLKDPKPVANLRLFLGRDHPFYALLSEENGARRWPPYAWYIRVPNVPALIQRLAPALERRLAGSPLAHHTGELKLDFYRSGLRLAFAQGRLVAAEPWQTGPWGPEVDGSCPPLVFLQLLFGHRSLAELGHAFPDVWVNAPARPLVEALFPPVSSWALPLD
jgi:predicted N-acetyltransferase YhbS